MTYIEELNMLMEQNSGLLSPHKVVEFAVDPDTALHKRFEWDDSKASQNWRLHQARMMISVLVTTRQEVKAKVFVSVVQDRKRDDSGGYRAVESVLSNDDLRSMFLDQCIKAIEALLVRFNQFKDLANILVEAKEKVEGLREHPDILAPSCVVHDSPEPCSPHV